MTKEFITIHFSISFNYDYMLCLMLTKTSQYIVNSTGPHVVVAKYDTFLALHRSELAWHLQTNAQSFANGHGYGTAQYIFLFQKALTNCGSQKCLWMQLDRPQTNQSN